MNLLNLFESSRLDVVPPNTQRCFAHTSALVRSEPTERKCNRLTFTYTCVMVCLRAFRASFPTSPSSPGERCSALSRLSTSCRDVSAVCNAGEVGGCFSWGRTGQGYSYCTEHHNLAASPMQRRIYHLLINVVLVDRHIGSCWGRWSIDVHKV
jgi:hypothetical protein